MSSVGGIGPPRALLNDRFWRKADIGRTGTNDRFWRKADIHSAMQTARIVVKTMTVSVLFPDGIFVGIGFYRDMKMQVVSKG